jgi:hypothetical protein
MKYLAVRCRGCEKEFAVERIDSIRQAVQFRRSSFKASYTCPHCSVTDEYTAGDLTSYEASMKDEPGPVTGV